MEYLATISFWGVTIVIALAAMVLVHIAEEIPRWFKEWRDRHKT